MTMNNSSNVPSSTEGVMLPVHMQQRSIRLPLMSKGLALLSHNINRKPVRRALIELGRNDRKHNSKLANRLLTISTEEFKQKWNFDPIKMKPITEGSTSATIISGDGLGPKKYQWELMKQSKAQEQEYKDKKELERTVFSLVIPHTDRKQMRLSTIAVQVSPSDDTSRGKASSSDQVSSSSRIPQLKEQEEESKVSSTTEEESNAVSAVTQSITDNGSSSHQQQQQPESITVTSSQQRTKEEELRKRLTADDASTAAASVDVVPTVTSATITNNNTQSSRQSKITDFASHRKIVHGPALKEDTDQQPPCKRPRLTC